MLEPVVQAVGNGSVVVQGGVDLADRLQHRVDAAQVEEDLLLPGERGVRQVLGGGAEPDGEGRFGVAGQSLDTAQMSASRAGENGCSTTARRISLPAADSVRTSWVSSVRSRSAMRAARPVSPRKRA